MNYGYIYRISCLPNGKVYIGQTTENDPLKRWSGHCAAARTTPKKTDYMLTRAIRKYGPELFEFTIIETCENQTLLDIAEIRMIAEFNSRKPNGYNLQEGGRGGKHHPTILDLVHAE